VPGKKRKKKEEEERKRRKFDQQQLGAGEGSEQQEQRSRAGGGGGGDDDYAVSTPQFAALKVRKAWRRHLYMFAFFFFFLGFVFCNIFWMLLQLKEFFCFVFHFSALQDFFFAAQSFSSFFPLSFFGSPPRDTWRVLQMQ